MLESLDLNGLYRDLVGIHLGRKADAVTRLYQHFRPLLFKKLRYQYQAIQETDLQDVIQEAFVKIYNTKSYPKDAASMSAWVFRVCENACLDLLRKAYRKHEMEWPEWPIDSEAPSAEVELQASAGLQEAGVDSDQPVSRPLTPLNRAVEFCVSSGMSLFSSQYPERALAISLAMDGLSMSAIALTLDRTEAATRQFIYESKKKLAPFIQHCLEQLR